MIRENCGTHSITLLFSFMCGSLLSLIYLIPNVPFRFAAFEMYFAVTELSAKEAAGRMGIMAVLIPLHFLVCSYGMAQSGIAREAMRQTGTYSRKQTLYTYAIMLAGLAAAALLIRHILRI